MKPTSREAIRELTDAYRQMEQVASHLGPVTDAHRAAHERLESAEQAARAAGVPWWRR